MDESNDEVVGNPIFKAALWMAWKKVQIFLRTKLSHWLALLLGVVTLIRERHALMEIVSDWHFGLEEVVILLVVAGTVFAALWELYGNKLSTSPQEVRFVAGMRSLLQALEKFIYGKDREADLDKRLNEFIKGFLEVTSSTLCGKKDIDAGLMLRRENGKEIELRSKTDGAIYPEKLLIPIPDMSEGVKTGPAGHAYQLLKIVYMPVKTWKLGWPFGYDKHYESLGAIQGWVPADDPSNEAFSSVLCIPVAVYEDRSSKERFGVLNYSTKSLDPFVPRDFIMGECFSSILAMAFAAAKREAAEQQKNKILAEALSSVQPATPDQKKN